MSVNYLLFEASAGYGIFKVKMEPDTVGNALKEVQDKSRNLADFGKMVELVSFAPFRDKEHTLMEANDISEGIMSDYLRDVLEANLPKPGKKHTVKLGVADSTLAGSIKGEFPGIECETNRSSVVVEDLLRGIRLHFDKLLKQLKEGEAEIAQRAVSLGYSRAKVKFNVTRDDNHIIQAIGTLDHIDKAVNTLAMRVREWYSWHFPELLRQVSDNYKYIRLALFIGNKATLSDRSEHDVAALVDDDIGLAQDIINAAKMSMGREVSEADMAQIMSFARRYVDLADYRRQLAAYLAAKMELVAPNLAVLIGETVGARLISRAGSLVKLAKAPASTVQILGAEKALFRALKTKGLTPKYGLIYNSSFIGRASARDKGRVSRYLANKCSIASRVDSFTASPTSRIGEALRRQVDERLDFYATGTAPTKNETAMKAAMDSILADIDVDASEPAATAVVPPVDEDMADVLPGSATNAPESKDKLAKKLSKEEKKLMKAARKRAAKGEMEPPDAAADVVMAETGAARAKVVALDVDDRGEEESKEERKRRKKEEKKKKRAREEDAAEEDVSKAKKEHKKEKKRAKHMHGKE